MGNVFSRDGFQWFIGVVEDRDDPEKLGRCKVRIYGHNSQFKSEQPTQDLPWSVPIQPITSAAMSGLGSSPTGPLPGTWVVGFYLDGKDMQQPAFFGTIGSSSAPTVFQDTPPKPNFTFKDSDDTLKDQSGQAITIQNKLSDGSPAIPNFNNFNNLVNSARAQSGSTSTSSGNANDPNRFANPAFRNAFPKKVGSPQNPNNTQDPRKESSIGVVIKKAYTPPDAKASGIEFNVDELGENADINASCTVYAPGDQFGDTIDGPFGFRYGVFKLASFLPSITPNGTRRKSSKTSPVLSFLKSDLGRQYGFLNSMEIGSEEFNSTWENAGYPLDRFDPIDPNNKDNKKGTFGLFQIKYIKKTYIEPVKSQCVRIGGPNLNFKPLPKGQLKEGGGFSLMSVLLNLSLDLGAVGAAEVIKEACKGKTNLSRVDVVELVTEFQLQNSDEVFNKLPQTQKDQIKVDQLNQREKLKKFEIPPFNPTTAFGDFGSGFNLSVSMEGTPDEKLTYNGNDPIVYDRINRERIRRGLPQLSNPRPTGEGNKEVRSTFGGTTDRFGNKITTKTTPTDRFGN